MSHHGMPCWYELASSDTAAAQQFYAAVLGWGWTNSNTPGMEYLMASTATGMVAGMMKVESPEQPVAWSFYTAVDDCDATAAKAQSLGAKLIVPPADIPGTGRFAVLIDPQGAGFAILQPLPGGQGGAFDQKQTGHGNWHDHASPDAKAAATFYGALFGWTVSRSMPMCGGMRWVRRCERWRSDARKPSGWPFKMAPFRPSGSRARRAQARAASLTRRTPR